jgi:hypothetical protein
VTERRRGREFAEEVRRLAEEDYPRAERIRLVCDNLSTHAAAAFYESFPPEQARRLARRIEFIYTPVHGSWPNMVEIELSVLVRQCLKRRLPERPDAQTGSGGVGGGAQPVGRQRGVALHDRRRRPHEAAQALPVY